MRINVRTGKDNTRMLSYPFVLSDGTTIEMWLPAVGLTIADAERLKAYIDTLVLSPEPE